ncbi:MAG: transglycosylase domain-containing protein, partial [Clostridiales Family XIII bacterium]|nr:transglycosylase domain-containing protein [Clostridiales Family XIII bacterium]
MANDAHGRRGKNDIDDFFGRFDDSANRSASYGRAGSRSARSHGRMATGQQGRAPKASQGRPASRPQGRTSPTPQRRSSQSSRQTAIPGRAKRRSTEGRRGTPGRFGRDHRGARKRSKHPVLKGVVTIIFIIILVALAAGVLYIYGAIKDIETPNPKDIADKLKISSTMYDSSGKVIKNLYLGEGQRLMATYEQLPENLKNAYIAIEDKTFKTHHGFNFVRIVGAIRDSVFKGTRVSGTSTISQQLARNIWLTDERSDRTMKRKIQEAYYAVQLENNLSKEEILTDYLNAIPLGYHSLGVASGAKNYFNKSVEDLDLIECAALASLPKSPTRLAMITTVERGAVEDDDPRLLIRGSVYDYLYNDAVLPRVKLVLDNMLDQKLITKAEYEAAMSEDLREHLNPTEIVGDSDAAFFVDWAIDNVAENLMKEYKDRFENKEKAKEFIYTNGLQIHSTFNRKIQKIAADELEDTDNYPGVRKIDKDGDGNILDEKGNLLLYKYSNIIGSKGRFTFRKKEVSVNADGSMTIYKGGRLNIYETTVGNEPDVSIEFKDMYQQDDKGHLYIIHGGVINVPQGYKTLDSKGNCVISAAFFEKYPDLIKVGDKIVVPKDGYTLKQKIIQPQGSAVILNHENGRVYAMVGGRGVKGEMNFNRALEPRQPGSTMKPLGAYGPAIQMSAEDEPIEDGEKSFGEYWSTLSIIIDEKFEYQGKVWPKNWYGSNSYRGPTTLRKSVEQSMNINAVKVQLNVGNNRSVDFLKKLGITTLVEEGRSNDLNPAALALGGMTNGAKPIEMASAYGAFANAGVRAAPISYTEVVDRNGKVI